MHFGARNETALGATKKRWRLFGRNGATFAWLWETQLDMPYIKCPKEREYVAHLSTLVVSLNAASSLSFQVNVCTVLDRPYDVLSFLVSFDCWGNYYDFERQMQLARSPMFASSSCGRDSLCSKVPEWGSGYEFRREMNVPSSLFM